MSLSKPHIGIITQARMTSTRLPGKVFKEVNSKSLLQYHIERLKETGFDIAIATTTNDTDDCISEYANQQKINVFRGSETDVLSRYYGTASKYNYDILVRVTSDCPLIDSHLIRNSIEKYLQLNNSKLYMSNALERTFARGFDFEIFSFELLKEAFEKATLESEREHVTPFIWKNIPGNVEFYHVKQSIDNSHLRITVDTSDDFELIRTLIEKYHADKLNYVEIETLLNEHPELVSINAHIEQKKL
ncbi:MAG: acylneuraminate cytidylyltransferase [Bacteroidetes bacterium]|jgi:spore coat polysaccharide biosynthesis protein SpsF|nr:acylneuraminate cytidylyltransferase [Bacteroidota bacterium]